jgi:lipopolysaccharide transport system ATP-binding protein
MSEILIKAEGVSKKYCKNLRQSMLYGIQDIGKAMLGMLAKTHKLKSEEFWAVNDISFELKRGDCLGIVGQNGSGKSTLLKILNGIICPDKGRVEINGSLGALIEIGAGFHPMLTGSENIYVNGSILGFSKREIDRRFDTIVEFSELSDFINSPVKHYSSGMRVRLGFAIAAQMDPDILLIDEVLAVGDLSFRNKCLRKIDEIKQKAKAIIFISHDMDQIKAICNHVLVLHHGQNIFMGETNEALLKYFSLSDEISFKRDKEGLNKKIFKETPSTKDITHVDTGILDQNRKLTKRLNFGENFVIYYEFLVHINIENPFIGIIIRNSKGHDIFADNSLYNSVFKIPYLKAGKRYKIYIEFKKPNICRGAYQLYLSVKNQDTLEVYQKIKNINFQILNTNLCHPLTTIQIESEFRYEEMN